jgi:hypothetical protein
VDELDNLSVCAKPSSFGSGVHYKTDGMALDGVNFRPTSGTRGDVTDMHGIIRRQHIETEQRRRDELRNGYHRLKEALPESNQKGSKCSFLDRGKYWCSTTS